MLYRDVFLVQTSDECRLGEAVFEREELVPGDRCGAGLQHSLGADRGEVRASTIAKGQRSGVVLRAEEACRRARVLELEE